jgi:hypothetical protein
VVPTRHRLPLAHVALRAGGRAAACCVTRDRAPTAVATPVRCAIPPPTASHPSHPRRMRHRMSRGTPTHVQPHPHANPLHDRRSITVPAHSLLLPPTPPARCYSRHPPHTAPALSRPLACPRCFAHAPCAAACSPVAPHTVHTPHHRAASCTAVMGLRWEWGGGGGRTGGCMCSLHSDASPGVVHAHCRSGRNATRRDDPTAPPPLGTAPHRCIGTCNVAAPPLAFSRITTARACLAARTDVPCVCCRLT